MCLDIDIAGRDEARGRITVGPSKALLYGLQETVFEAFLMPQHELAVVHKAGGLRLELEPGVLMGAYTHCGELETWLGCMSAKTGH